METLQRTANRGSISTGYDIDNSLKFEADNSENLYYANSVGENRRTWTYSTWIKKTEVGFGGVGGTLFGAYLSSNDRARIEQYADQLGLHGKISGTTAVNVRTNRVLRDTSAWYHCMVVLDTTQATETDRVKIYINGVQETSMVSATYPPQNYQFAINNAVNHYVGQKGDGTDYFCGYMAETYFIDGQALTPTSFGEFDDTGIWKPKKFSGTYPSADTNHFYLNFDNSSSLGADSSGNGKNMSLTNITAADQATDSPTNNFATFNVLQPRASGTTITKGGTDFYINSNYQTAVSSIAVTTGKWYAEFTCDSTTSFIGIVDVADAYIPQDHSGYYLGYAGGNQNRSVGLRGSDGALLNRTGDFWGASYSAGNIIGVGLNMDDRKINFSVNGTWMSSDNSGTPANGATWNTSSSLGDAWTDVITMGVTGYSNIHWKCNFGGYTDISISSGNSDANGYGNFEYAVPSGFYALCTKNLAEFG